MARTVPREVMSIAVQYLTEEPATTPSKQGKQNSPSSPTPPALPPQHTLVPHPNSSPSIKATLPTPLLTVPLPLSPLPTPVLTSPSIAMATTNPSIKLVKPSLEDLLKDIPPEKLDQSCRDDDLNKVALSLTDWQSIAPFLGLTEADEEEIKRDYPNIKTQRISMLRKWKKIVGRKAKYRKLVSVFWDLERADLVEKVCELLQTESSSSSSEEDGPPSAKRSRRGTKGSYANQFRRECETTLSARDKVVGSVVTMDGTSSQATQPKQRIKKKLFGKRKSVLYPCTGGPQRSQKGTLDSYAEYLRGRYSTELPAFFTLQWPPPPTRKVFNLAMIRHQTVQRGPVDEELVRLTLRGGVDDIMRRKSPIELKKLFKLDDEKRKIILIEGAPGSGKSTLAWHICQKWESGVLFQEFKVVVFVQLRDPVVQSAMSLADILPARSSNMRTEIQSIMEACDGRGVLFVLDGWDEYGPGLHHSSLFQQLICTPGEVNMHFSSLIITSRPIASGELQRYASSRVEIVGFTTAEVKKYFSESIGNNETVQKLHDHLRERPVIEASCYLPLNAAIIVHLFLALNHTLPHTLHEVFLKLVLCCIIRHLTKEAEGGKEIPHISSLDDLPPDVLEPFNNICTMAYHGVMKNKITFSATDLQLFNLPTELSTLSLIQGVQSFAAFQSSVSCNFLHLSVQELLAAFHISKLSPPEQIQIFNDLFDQPRLSAVFQSYAAFTKLHTEGVRDIVARIIQKQEKPLLVNLLHGLYEAQDLSLCQFVACHLQGELDLCENILSPMDCLVVGYFLSACICLTTSGEFKVNLRYCSLDDYRISLLVRECATLTYAQTITDDGVPGCLAMDLRENHSLSGYGIDSLLQVMNVFTVVDLSDPKQMLLTECFPHLNISANFQLGDDDIVDISNSLKTNTTLKRMSAGRCNITEKGGKAIGDALMVNRSLQVLDLSDNPISAGVVHIAESLKHNHSLLEINFDRCGITEKESQSLAISLKENKSLQTLILNWNILSDRGAAHMADCLRHNKCLKKLDISFCGLSDPGMKSLASVLEMNGSLEELNFSGNDAVTGVGLMALGECLKRNKGLKTLKTARCGISEKGGKSIGDALMVNRSLQSLDLRDNPISSGAIHIAESLKHNPSLIELNLGNCGISEEGGKAIGDALMVNISLQVLYLCDNPISTGVVYIAKSLKYHHSLIELNLEKCGISGRGTKSLATSLRENTSLQTLILNWNILSDRGAAHVADCLRHNKCLKILCILSCGVGDHGIKSLASALEVNSSLALLDLRWSNNTQGLSAILTGIGLMALGESLKSNRGLKTLRLCGWLYHISDNDWKQFIVCLQENNDLTVLELPDPALMVVKQEVTILNDIRRKNNVPPLVYLKVHLGG